VSRSSSDRPCGTLRWVERCLPRVRQARRSDTPRGCRTWSMHNRRREGLRGFPGQPKSESVSPGAGQTRLAEAAGSQPPAPSTVAAGPDSCRHTACANGNRSALSPRSAASIGQLTSPGPAALPRAATSKRSPRACHAFLLSHGPPEIGINYPTIRTTSSEAFQCHPVGSVWLNLGRPERACQCPCAMAVPMTGNDILLIRGYPLVALARQGAGQFIFPNGFDKAASPYSNAIFIGIEPAVEKYGLSLKNQQDMW
jgi:hypothetical protein